MRCTDYLRAVQLLSIKGYPEQAGTLAASIFELAHTAMFFAHTPDKATTWVEADSIEQDMPRATLGTSWKQVVKVNFERLGAPTYAESEYQVYSQLCWMKHSLPKMQDMRVTAEGAELQFGPYTDERAVNHAWFALEHAGRLVESTISLLIDTFGCPNVRDDLNSLSSRREALKQLAIGRFGSFDPFERVSS
jgi:hypothetical protein